MKNSPIELLAHICRQEKKTREKLDEIILKKS